MKGSGKVIAIIILGLLMLGAVPVQQARAAPGYSERLQVDIAGDSALWYMTFSGVNGSSKLAAFESTPGLSWYNVTAIDTAAWISDYQVFGPNGYNLIPVPFIPSHGAFLTVGSDSFADAVSAASALDSYLTTAFVSYSNATYPSGAGNFTFYSPLSFDSVVPKTLLTLMPSEEGGFANAIFASSFEGSNSPMVVLEGVASSGGFEHTLVVGSIYRGALTTKDAPSLLKYFGNSSITYLQAAKDSTSSVIQVRALDGLMSSKDAAVVKDDNSTFSSSYTLSVPAGEKIYSLNATVVEQAPYLMAYRSVYPAVLFPGDNISVTDTLTDISKYPVKIQDFTDDWWQQPEFAGLFRLVSNTTFPTSIANSSTVTPVYVLQYVGSATEKLTIPPTAIHFTYTVSSAKFQGSSSLNPVPLSLGSANAVVFTYVKMPTSVSLTVGESVNATVVATNEGTLAASSVTVAGESVPGLAAEGGSADVNVTISASGLAGFDRSGKYSVTYASPLNPSQILNVSTNSVDLQFAQTSMKIAFPELTLSESTSQSSTGAPTLVLNFTATNGGSEGLLSYKAEGSLPTGLACGATKGKGMTCSDGKFELSYASIATGKTETAQITVDVSDQQNYVLPPVPFSAVSSGYVLGGSSNALAVPLGLVATKQFALDSMFPGMTSGVNITVRNLGPYSVYNATIGSVYDSFDTLVSKSIDSATFPSIAPGQNKSVSYSVNSSAVFGRLASANVSEGFYFAGTLFSIEAPGPYVEVYKPLMANLTESPASPTEGKSFVVDIKITNPSGLEVSDVKFKLPFASGTTFSAASNLIISGRSVTVSNSTLGPHGVLTASVDVTATSGTSVEFSSGSLTFTYDGFSLKGSLPPGGIAVGENVTVRYLIPIALVIIALLAVTFYVRRMAFPTSPASQR